MSAAVFPKENTRSEFLSGMHDCIPVATGYFVVSFTLGIAMRNAGLTPVEGLLCSLLNNASAGEYAGITCIASGTGYAGTALMTLIANLRYLLMSCSLSQKFSEKTPFFHRFLVGFDVTDELFGLAMAHPGPLSPAYSYGTIALAMPAWGIGTLLGVMAGNILPASLVSAFSAALYGMFLAIIVPPAKENKAVRILVSISFLASVAASILPGISSLSEGTRTIILTLLLAGGAALIAPVKEDQI